MAEFPIERYMQELTALCAIDSGRGNGEGTRRMAAFFKSRFDALGLKTQVLYDSEDNDFAPVLIARNSNSEQIDALFVAHMDTVFPVGDGAARPLTIDENGVGRGPGCVDCKGGCLLVEYIVRDLISRGACPFNFCVAFNSDEERASRHSRAYFEALAKKSRYCFVFEPGRAKEEFVSARKGGANYLIKCRGIAAHSGVEPEKGASAILELSRWIADLYTMTDYAAGTTLNVGRFTGGGEGGAVPDYAEFTLSFRYLDPAALDRLRERLAYMQANRFDPRTRIEVDEISLRPPMARHPATEALLGELRAAADGLGLQAQHIVTGGGSDGNFISCFGVATLDGCGPCGASLHTDQEYILVDSVARRFELMEALLRRLFG